MAELTLGDENHIQDENLSARDPFDLNRGATGNVEFLVL